MVKRSEVLLYLEANKGKGFDYDGAYGVQCMDLINHVFMKFFNYSPALGKWGVMYPNDIKQKVSLPAGWSFQATANAGDIGVIKVQPGYSVGHIVIMGADAYSFFDQNGTGHNDPITHRGRISDDKWAFFIRPPYTAENDTSPVAPSEVKRIEQHGTFIVGTTVNIRRNPSLTGTVAGQLKAGDSVYYDSYCDNNGYRWVSWIGASGNRNYAARRTLDNTTIFGECK